MNIEREICEWKCYSLFIMPINWFHMVLLLVIDAISHGFALLQSKAFLPRKIPCISNFVSVQHQGMILIKYVYICLCIALSLFPWLWISHTRLRCIKEYTHFLVSRYIERIILRVHVYITSMLFVYLHEIRLCFFFHICPDNTASYHGEIDCPTRGVSGIW